MSVRRLPVLFLTEGKSHYVSTRHGNGNSVCGLYPHIHRWRETQITRALSVHLPTCRRCLRLAQRRPTGVLTEVAS